MPSKNDRVPDLRDVHGIFALARILGIILAAILAATAIVLFS